MVYTIESFMELSPKELGQVCKTYNVKSYTTKKYSEIFGLINNPIEPKKIVKKTPNESPKDYKGKQLEGNDGSLYTSTSNEKGTSWRWVKDKEIHKIVMVADFSKPSSYTSDTDNEQESNNKSKNKNTKPVKLKDTEKKKFAKNYADT